MKFKKLLNTLGPGLLYAGAAVGVSHLVQSTRAGAGYGFELLWILILANVIKYPFFEFGPRYAAATGKSLIEGYRQIGKWAVNLSCPAYHCNHVHHSGCRYHCNSRIGGKYFWHCA